ncbi:hypothetical protein PG987_009022 [Apiospora arundinis]
MRGATSLLLAAVTYMQLYVRVARAADRPPAPPAPTGPFCEGECRKNFTAGWEYDSSRWVISDLSHDSYWDLPSNLSSAVPGDILRWQDLDSAAVGLNWTIPGGNSLSRFQYATEDVDGATVAASAFLLMPYAAPRRSGGSGQLRTLAWAHGTAGPSKLCAPSNHKNLYYDWQAAFSFAQLGYAVIAPDYAGLGSMTPRGFQWCAGWTSDPAVADWRKTYNREGLTDLVAPLLIVQGTSDGIVPPHLTYKEYEKTCAARPESRLTLLTYEGLNHDTVTNSAQADYMAWLDDLFNGKEVEQGCSRVDIKPLTNHFKNTTTSYQATM